MSHINLKTLSIFLCLVTVSYLLVNDAAHASETQHKEVKTDETSTIITGKPTLKPTSITKDKLTKDKGVSKIPASSNKKVTQKSMDAASSNLIPTVSIKKQTSDLSTAEGKKKYVLVKKKPKHKKIKMEVYKPKMKYKKIKMKVPVKKMKKKKVKGYMIKKHHDHFRR